MYNLYTEAGDEINGKQFTTVEEMIDAVRLKYGSAALGIIEGTIIDADGEDIGNFGVE